MKYVSFDGSRYRCYLSETGRDATYLGCYHDKPRQAIQHTSGTYASPHRSVSGSSYPAEAAGIASRGGPLSEGADRTPQSSSPADVPPSAGDQLGL